jgi:branched-chain amino acid transport system substrate-binding protein
MISRFVPAALLSGVIALLALGSPAARSETPPPLTIDVVVSLTGSAAFVGAGARQSLGILEGVVNREGGIHGAPLHFAYHDDQSSPQVALQLYGDLIAKHVPLILGPNAVATCGAIQPLLATQVVSYCLSPAINPAPGSYSYSAGMSAFDITNTALRYFAGRGWRRIALINSTDATGASFNDNFEASLALPQNRSVTKIMTERFNPTDLTVAAQMARIKQANPDGLFAFSLGTPFGTVMRGYTDAGLTLPIATSTANMSLAQMAQYGQFDTGKLYVVGFRYFDRDRIARGPLRDTIETFFRAYAAAGVKPDSQPGFTWDVGLLAVAALRSAGVHATAAQIKGFIDKQQSFIGINGLYDFRAIPQRGIDYRSAVMTRWDPSKAYWVVVSSPGGVPR